MPVHITPLTPLAFLERSASVFAGAVAVVHGDRRITYHELAAEVTRVARALQASGVAAGDRVAYLCHNAPALLVAHFAVPLAGGVLVAVNTRLAPEEVLAICAHSGARLIVVDTALAGTVEPVLDRLPVDEVIWDDDADPVPPGAPGTAYAAFRARGSDDPLPWAVEDEDATISINYTSGTTGTPKGVMYTHRGAYLNSLGENLTAGHGQDTVYLWTLPMFHCNGWCHPWAIVACGGVQVCLRAVRDDAIWRLIDEEGITHLNGAPAVLSLLVNSERAHPLGRLTVVTAAAPPSPTILAQTEALGARVVHVYGLTETYGPYTVCQWQPGWAGEEPAERARLLARQGVAMVMADPIRVVDETGADVPRDGVAVGEIVMSGNDVMKGYHDDPEATAAAFRGGVFHSGDLGVWHPDGYIELRDRAKDVVISGGENISTIEVEQALASHPAVLEVAVIGVPSERWGERPKAFVVLRPGASAGHDELTAHMHGRIARYKCPDTFEVLEELPRTSTGKVRKFELREREWGHLDRRIN